MRSEYKKIMKFLWGLSQPILHKNDTNMRYSILVNVILAATVRYLATGDSYSDLQYESKVHASTLSKFIQRKHEISEEME